MVSRKREKMRKQKERKRKRIGNDIEIAQRVERLPRVEHYTTVVKHNFHHVLLVLVCRGQVTTLDNPKIIVRIVVSIVRDVRCPSIVTLSRSPARYASMAVKLETLGAYTVLCTQSNVVDVRDTVSGGNWKKKYRRVSRNFSQSSIRLRSSSSELHSISFVFSNFFLLALFICRTR